MPVALPGIVSALGRLFRHSVWIGWLMILIAAAFSYVKKAEDGQSAFIRWRPQVLQLISGVNIYDTKMFGSSVLKCEAWDFSLFCRSQSFC